MEKIFDKQGSYNYTSFIGSSGTWKLQSSQENGDLLKTLDTFTDGKGEYRTYERHQVIEQDKLGHIKPILESKVNVPTISSKEWNKKIVRSI